MAVVVPVQPVFLPGTSALRFRTTIGPHIEVSGTEWTFAVSVLDSPRTKSTVLTLSSLCSQSPGSILSLAFDSSYFCLQPSKHFRVFCFARRTIRKASSTASQLPFGTSEVASIISVVQYRSNLEIYAFANARCRKPPFYGELVLSVRPPDERRSVR